MKIYISYARADQAIAQRLSDALQRRGHDVLVDWDTISPGEAWADEISRRLDQADVILVLWSQRSAQSHWILEEAAVAQSTNKLVPIAIDDVEPPLGFRQYNTLRLSGSDAENLVQELDYILEARQTTTRRPSAKSRSQSFNPYASQKSSQSFDYPVTPPGPPPLTPLAPPEINSPAPDAGTPAPEQILPAPSESYDVFISYSRSDKDLCKFVFESLVQQGLNPWYDKDVGSGDFKEKIVQRIRGSRVFMLLLSEHSRGSPNVAKELSIATAEGVEVIPVSIDGTKQSDLNGAFAFDLTPLNIFEVQGKDDPSWGEIITNVVAAAQRIAAREAAAQPGALVNAPSPVRTRTSWFKPFVLCILILIIAAAQLSGLAILAMRLLAWKFENVLAASIAASGIALIIAAAAIKMLRVALAPKP